MIDILDILAETILGGTFEGISRKPEKGKEKERGKGFLILVGLFLTFLLLILLVVLVLQQVRVL